MDRRKYEWMKNEKIKVYLKNVLPVSCREGYNLFSPLPIPYLYHQIIWPWSYPAPCTIHQSRFIQHRIIKKNFQAKNFKTRLIKSPLKKATFFTLINQMLKAQCIIKIYKTLKIKRNYRNSEKISESMVFLFD